MSARTTSTLLTLAGGLMLVVGLIFYSVNHDETFSSRHAANRRQSGWLIAFGLASVMAGITLRPEQPDNDD